jgi:hypothetical protein
MYVEMYLRYEELRLEFGLAEAKRLLKEEYSLTDEQYLELLSEAED